jgi:hypothetical protein
MRITKDIMKNEIRPNFNILGVYHIGDVKSKHNGHWFSKDTMRFFKSRVNDEVFCSKKLVFFVSSEKKGFDDDSRAFTVRVFNPMTKQISTEEFLQYETLAQAKSEALRQAYNLSLKGE